MNKKDLWEVATNDDAWTGCVDCVFTWLKDIGIEDAEYGKNYSNDPKGIYVSEDVFHALSEERWHDCDGCGAELF
jgi:hypothetical protein